MFQTNYIFKVQYYGRRLESIHRVARRWKITNEEAAELMTNVEIQQSDNKLNQYKLLIEGPVYRGKNNLDEYKLLPEGPTIYSDYEINLLDKKNINKSRRLNNIEFEYGVEEKHLLDEDTVNNNNGMEEKHLLDEDPVFLNSLSSNNSSNQLIQRYEFNQETNQETNQAIKKRRHTTTCCCF